MKVKLPKAVWVGFDGEMNPINAVCDKRNYRLCHRLARYHLHPGNEVKLKRENAMMRRWVKMAFVAEQFVRAHKEIERKMPGLFVKGTRE